jgi:hypothetical protein
LKITEKEIVEANYVISPNKNYSPNIQKSAKKLEKCSNQFNDIKTIIKTYEKETASLVSKLSPQTGQ